MTHEDCQSELWLWARRGRLSTPTEIAAWEAHRQSCCECRLAYDIAEDFDSHAVHKSDDGDMLARLTTTAVRVHAHTPWASRSRSLTSRRAVLGAAILLSTAAAAAATLTFTQWGKTPTFVPPVDEASLVSNQPAPAPAPVMVPRSLSTVMAIPLPSADSPPSIRPAAAVEPAQTQSASALYRLASEARRAGESARAIRLYRTLQHNYPSSAEATLSAVSVGGLLLDSGSARAALAQFDRHLAAPGPKPLGAEALYGRGRALSALGQSAEEMKTWERLVREYPACPYLSHARRRIAALSKQP
jgi:hypothetical protein